MVVKFSSVLLATVTIVQLSECQSPPLRGPPMFELNPQYSDSYIPAGMQVIAYLTELMKYDLKPTSDSNPVTSRPTTTFRPTPSHLPGIFAPNRPQSYYTKVDPYQQYVQWVLNPNGKPFSAVRRSPSKDDVNLEAIKVVLRQLDATLDSSSRLDDLDLLGDGPASLHKVVNGLDEDNNNDDEDVRVYDFAEKFDDSNIKQILLRQKKIPPTRAYVTLLSLYDLLNKESKKLSLNKFNGFSEWLLRDLHETATGSSSYQLKYILNKIVLKRNTNDPNLVKKIKTMVDDLDEDSSYINVALRYIPALPFEL